MTTLNLSSAPVAGLRGVEALVVGVVQDPRGPQLAPYADAVDAALDGRLLAALQALGATGKAGETVRLATLGALRVPTVLAVGLGKEPGEGASHDAEVVRRAAGSAVRALTGVKKVAFSLGGPELVRPVAEGALLGAYSFDRFRSRPTGSRPPVTDVTLLVPNTRDPAVKSAVRRAQVVARAVGLARDLVNTPPGHLHPAELAEAAVEAAAGLPLEVEVLDEKALRKGGYGGIVGVGQGSSHPPRLIRLSYRPEGATTSVAIVGKGITFDSGGLSLKPAQAMEWMKSDMAGAAAVIAALTAIAALGPRVNVTGWVPTAENMPGGGAIRPSDVLTMYGGTRVEVLNTDAEGRLILGDAMARACEDSPDILLDVATLTGAQLVALGTRTAGVMGNDDDLRAQVVAAAGRAGEPMWPMPLPPELRKSLDSEIADLANVGDRNGGMLVAGTFLAEFVAPGVRWAHLDIAGPAFNNDEAFGYTPKGGTGAAVRAFVELAEELAG